jgi:hypothetical protein
VAAGVIGRRHKVAAILTGHILKDPDAIPRAQLITVEPTVEALREFFGRTGV